MVQEFLPLCDVLFNIISLASYFCDVVFDVIVAYTLLAVHNKVPWFGFALCCILGSLLASQAMSIKWYLKKKNDKTRPAESAAVVVVHVLQCGVLWRYFKLFVPVDLVSVKHEVRDLCMLRLVHGFCEAAPMLLLQLNLTWRHPSAASVPHLDRVSTFLSLFSVCWALASFGKNVRRRNIHRLVLTWLGVICQFFWRLGTIASRAAALTAYASLYGHWVFLVMLLHWLAMFLWLISPKNLFHGEGMPPLRRLMYSVLVAYVQTFCYINLQESNAVPKMVAFYVIMFLENSLLVAVWLSIRQEEHWFDTPALLLIWGGFIVGIVFMLLYYRFFHIRRLKHVLGFGLQEAQTANDPPRAAPPRLPDGVATGVFNCRLNPALKRKKKKPSTFVPVPSAPPGSLPLPDSGKLPPFWKRCRHNSDKESSVGSRVDIQQKLQEKKRQQLQELLEIEEEIKQGKLPPSDLSERGTLPPRQPIPRSKKQPWLRTEPAFQYRTLLGGNSPEVLLSPHYLDDSCLSYDFGELPSDVSSGVSSRVTQEAVRELYRVPPSDADSQLSLPRSYTLPRELRRLRRMPRVPRRAAGTPDNNSSDGDVDSADEDVGVAARFRTCRTHPALMRGLRPETQL